MNLIKNILGIVLLVLGLAVTVYALYSSYNIFTAQAAAPEIFKTQPAASGGEGIQTQIQNLIEEQLAGMLPVDSLPTLLNLISWSILAGILIFGGAQIAALGIKLIK